jgi:hypothetical protein
LFTAVSGHLRYLQGQNKGNPEEALWQRRQFASATEAARIPDGKGATVRITFADARKGVRELDLTDAEAEDARPGDTQGYETDVSLGGKSTGRN